MTGQGSTRHLRVVCHGRRLLLALPIPIPIPIPIPTRPIPTRRPCRLGVLGGLRHPLARPVAHAPPTHASGCRQGRLARVRLGRPGRLKEIDDNHHLRFMSFY